MAKKDWKKVRDKRGKDGKTVGAVVVNTNTGVQKTLLNPHGRYSKYTVELKNNQHYTNDGQKKQVKGHNTLSRDQKKFREGYRSAMIDVSKAYKAGKGGSKDGGAF